jgi:hypothetical protein
MDAEQRDYVIFSRLALCQFEAATKLDWFLAAGMLKEWNEYLPMYWMVIHLRLEYELKVFKVIQAHKSDPHWTLAKFDQAVSQP